MQDGTSFGAGLLAKMLLVVSSILFIHWVLVAFGPDGAPFSYPGARVIDFVAAAGLMPAAYWMAGHTKQQNQANRDRLAATVMDKLRNKATVDPFCLYLRSFETTGNLALPPAARTGNSLDMVNADLESFVSKAVFKKYPLICLGKPGEHIGAGRILTTEDDWQDDLHLLADAAALIFVVPALKEGVKWELDFLRSNDYFKKSVFIMPSHRTVAKSAAKDFWPEIQETFGKMGYQFPQYQKEGMLFLLESNQRADFAWSLGKLSPILVDFVTLTADSRLHDDGIDAKFAEIKERAAAMQNPEIQTMLENLQLPRRWDDMMKEASERKDGRGEKGQGGESRGTGEKS